MRACKLVKVRVPNTFALYPRRTHTVQQASSFGYLIDQLKIAAKMLLIWPHSSSKPCQITTFKSEVQKISFLYFKVAILFVRLFILDRNCFSSLNDCGVISFLKNISNDFKKCSQPLFLHSTKYSIEKNKTSYFTIRF